MTIITDLSSARDSIVDSADKLDRVVNGPVSGPTSAVTTGGGPVKTLARAMSEAAAVPGRAFALLADLEAEDGTDDNESATVWSDPTAANNGVYRWDDGTSEWVKLSDNPNQRLDTAEADIDALQSGASTLGGRMTTAEGEIDALQAVATLAGITSSRVNELELLGINSRLVGLAATDDEHGEQLGALDTALTADAARITTLEGHNAGARLGTLEAVNAGPRIQAIESQNAGTRLPALEAGQAVFEVRFDGLEAGTLADAGQAEVALLWSASVTKEPQTRAAIAAGDVVTSTADGKVIRVEGAKVRAPRASYRLLPGHRYSVLAAARRVVNSTDPSGDSVDLRAAWLSGSKSKITFEPLESFDLYTASGMHLFRKVVALTAGAGVNVVAPAGSVYFTPYVQTYGADGVTDIIPLIKVVDLTDNTLVSADLGGLEARMAALESLNLGSVVEGAETYTPPWEDAVARTKSGRLADRLTLDDFAGGSVDFYTGEDDTTAAWNAALAAAKADGRVLEVPRAGTYEITEEIAVPDGVRIELNPGAVIRQATVGLGAFIVSGDNVTIDGKGAVIEYVPTRTDPGGFYLGGAGRERISGCFVTGHNPTIRHIRPKNWFNGVHLRGPVVEQALSSTGYDHSTNGQGLLLDGIAADACDYGVRGGQYQDGLISRVSSINETTTSGDAGIVALIGLASGTAYAGIAKRLAIRHVQGDGFTGSRCITVGGGAQNVTVADVLLSNMAGTAIRFSGSADGCRLGANVRITGIKSGQNAVEYVSALNCGEKGVTYEGAAGVPFIAVRASSSAANIVVEEPRVVTDFTAPTDVTTQNLFRAISSAMLRVEHADIRHKQANTMFAFGADSATVQAIWPRNRGNTNGRVMRLDGSAIGLLRAYTTELEGFDELSSNSLTVNGTLTKDLIWPFNAPRWISTIEASTSPGFAAALQAKIAAATVSGVEVRIGPGPCTLDAQSAVGNDGNLLKGLIGYNGGTGAGKKITLRGSGMDKTILTAGVDADFVLRFGGDRTNPVAIEISDMTVLVGSITGTKPLIYVQNAILKMRRVRTRGADDLTRGSGVGGNGTLVIDIEECEFVNSALNAVGFGAGSDGGGRFAQTEDNRPWAIRLVNNVAENFGLHAYQAHTPRDLLIEGNKGYHDVPRFGFVGPSAIVRTGNGGNRSRIAKNSGFGGRCLVQANDADGLEIEGNIGELMWASGIIVGGKNTPHKDAVVNGNILKNIGRNMGREKPADSTDPDDGDNDDLSFFQVQSGITIFGTHGGVANGNLIASDTLPDGWGRVIAEKGNPEITIVDDERNGKDYAGASKFNRGDIVSVGGKTLGRIATAAGSIGDRTYYDEPNGDGNQIGDPVPWGTEPAEGQFVNGGSTVMVVTLDGGAAFDVGTIADLGDALLKAGSKWQYRQLQEEYIRVGLWKHAPTTPGEVWKWVPMKDPSFYIDGPAGSTISTTEGATGITGSGSPSAQLLSLLKTKALDYGAPVDLFGVDGEGRSIFLCSVASVASETAATASADGAVRTYTGAWRWNIKQKMRQGGFVGYNNTARNRAREWKVEGNQVLGAFGSKWRLYYDSMSPDAFPKSRRTTLGWTGSTATDIDAFPPPDATGNQAIWKWTIRVMGTVTGTVNLLLQCDQGGSRTTLATVNLTGKAAGDVVPFAWTYPVNDSDNMPDGNLVNPDLGQMLVLRASPTGSATLPILMHELPIGPW